MKKLIHCMAIVILCFSLITRLEAQENKFTERILATIPDTYKTITLAYVAPGGESFMYAGEKDDGTAVSYCGNEIATGLGKDIRLHPNNGGGILLSGTLNGKRIVILNDKVFKTEVVKIASLTVSPNGQHLAYLTEENRKHILHADGKSITPPFDYLGTYGELWINDDGLWATKAKKGGQEYMLMRDRKFGPYAYVYGEVGGNVFSKDGKHLAFYVRKDKINYGSKYQPNVYLVVDGEEKNVGDMSHLTLAISPDGRSICHVMAKGDQSYMAVDGENAYPFDGYGYFTPRWVNGKFLYVASNNGRSTIVYGNQSTVCEKDLSELSIPVVSKDGKVLAYSGNISETTFTSNGEVKQIFEGYIVLNGKREKALGCVKSFVLSADGKVAAYVAEYRKTVNNNLIRRQVAVIKNQPGKVYTSIEHLICSDDGKYIAYIAHDSGKTFFVMGTQESEPFDQVWTPTFSDDVKKVAFASRKGRQLLWKVIEIEKVGK